jgi:hypothetical protein
LKVNKNATFSISATVLRNQIAAVIESVRKDAYLSNQLPVNLVYSHPTISELAQIIIRSTYSNDTISSASFVEHRALPIENCITKFSAGLSKEGQNGSQILPAVILLTGSTGSLGSFLLDSLLQDDRVSKVYAYNRPGNKSTKERQVAAFIDRDLDATLLDSPKLIFVDGVLHQKNLGLLPGVYDEVKCVLAFYV